tara:strand:+ start:840 stop:1337 length:498 start_codon:yes stop_codon:yes gene_type:complete
MPFCCGNNKQPLFTINKIQLITINENKKFTKEEVPISDFYKYYSKITQHSFILIKYIYNDYNYKLIFTSSSKPIIFINEFMKNSLNNISHSSLINPLKIISAMHNNYDITNQLNEYFEPIFNITKLDKKYIKINNKYITHDINIILSNGHSITIKKSDQYIDLSI